MRKGGQFSQRLSHIFPLNIDMCVNRLNTSSYAMVHTCAYVYNIIFYAQHCMHALITWLLTYIENARMHTHTYIGSKHS